MEIDNLKTDMKQVLDNIKFAEMAGDLEDIEKLKKKLEELKKTHHHMTHPSAQNGRPTDHSEIE